MTTSTVPTAPTVSCPVCKGPTVLTQLTTQHVYQDKHPTSARVMFEARIAGHECLGPECYYYFAPEVLRGRNHAEYTRARSQAHVQSILGISGFAP